MLMLAIICAQAVRLGGLGRETRPLKQVANHRVFKEYPQKSQIWKSETSPNQGTWLGIPWLKLVSLCQIWDFYGDSLNTLKYPKMGIRYFFLWICFACQSNKAPCWTNCVSVTLYQLPEDSLTKLAQKEVRSERWKELEHREELIKEMAPRKTQRALDVATENGSSA